MDNNIKSITIKLLGKEYKINCPNGQESQLMDAALHLDRQMLTIRKNGRLYGLERIAIMAALNVTHELLIQNHSKQENATEINSRLQQLNDKIDQALENQEKHKQEALV